MFVLDTNTLSHHLRGHQQTTENISRTTSEVVITVVTRIEMLQGRFAAIVKAENAAKLLLAQQRLKETETDLSLFTALPLDAPSAAEFERLLGTKGVRRIGRGDLLIASICLARKATL